EELSGGLVTNIGIHLFDLLIWIFGPFREAALLEQDAVRSRGTLQLENARVKWFLSIDESDLPTASTKRSFREMKVDGQTVRLDQGIESLHNQCYTQILAGTGPGIEAARPSIQLCAQLRELGALMR
ncbi:MAG TPA: Gfo/Idh/MocA family oxidoreductase, partial [Chitinophagaceae bacterium]|nr:Gfo/Idh/MocA family oxidoreductase [Chitinophagaceae bacterium]